MTCTWLNRLCRTGSGQLVINWPCNVQRSSVAERWQIKIIQCWRRGDDGFRRVHWSRPWFAFEMAECLFAKLERRTVCLSQLFGHNLRSFLIRYDCLHRLANFRFVLGKIKFKMKVFSFLLLVPFIYFFQLIMRVYCCHLRRNSNIQRLAHDQTSIELFSLHRRYLHYLCSCVR